jgi:uncharacterized protein YfaP (DUF2135 family)
LLDLNRRFGHHIFFAGFGGFLLGILFSVAVWAGYGSIQTQIDLAQEGGLSNLFNTPFALSVKSPAEGDTVAKNTVTISGNVSYPATIVISGGAGDVVIDSTGSFTTNYDLLEGDNELIISAIDGSGHQSTVTRSIFYTTESFQ